MEVGVTEQEAFGGFDAYGYMPSMAEEVTEQEKSFGGVSGGIRAGVETGREGEEGMAWWAKQ